MEKKKRYVLKTSTQWVNTTRETPLDDFDESDFKRYEEGFDERENESYHQMAVEDQGLEWWIEEEDIDEDDI